MKEMGERNMQKRDLFNLKTIANEWENVIKSVSGIPCAKYFKPEDKVAEVIITISRK